MMCKLGGQLKTSIFKGDPETQVKMAGQILDFVIRKILIKQQLITNTHTKQRRQFLCSFF